MLFPVKLARLLVRIVEDVPFFMQKFGDDFMSEGVEVVLTVEKG